MNEVCSAEPRSFLHTSNITLMNVLDIQFRGNIAKCSRYLNSWSAVIFVEAQVALVGERMTKATRILQMQLKRSGMLSLGRPVGFEFLPPRFQSLSPNGARVIAFVATTLEFTEWSVL